MKIPRSVCDQPGCRFRGKPAAQGVCFSLNNDVATKYLKQTLQSGEDFLKEAKSLRRANKHTGDKAWIKYLEGQIVCGWANNTFSLDELVHLRAENARLRLRLGKWQGR